MAKLRFSSPQFRALPSPSGSGKVAHALAEAYAERFPLQEIRIWSRRARANVRFMEPDEYVNLAVSPKGFVFGDPVNPPSKEPVDAIDVQLDENGQLTQSLTLEPGSVTGPVSVALIGSLFESGGRPVSRILKRTLWPAAQLVGVRPLFDPDSLNSQQQAQFEVLKVDEKGIAHIKMLGACIDCPISILTMKLGIQRLLKEHFSEITGVHAITDVSIADLYRSRDEQTPALPTGPTVAGTLPAFASLVKG